jgi:hypothetical protein
MSTYLENDAHRIRSLVDDNFVPEGADSLFLIYAVLMRSKGQGVGLSDVHDAWSAWMVMNQRVHPSIVPFNDLSRDVRRKDEAYAEAIRRAASDSNPR